MLKKITSLGMLTVGILLLAVWMHRDSPKSTAFAQGADTCTRLINSCSSDCDEAVTCREEVLKKWVAQCKKNPLDADEIQQHIIAECNECNRRCRWFEGTWEGKGYQSNTKTSWTIRFTAQGDSYDIEYPSLSCGGKWYLLSKTSAQARFRERITYGREACVDSGLIMLERVNSSELGFRWSENDSGPVLAAGRLRRQ
ncbi:MAG: hypothetical protein QOF62_1511 [Pyrinomonadaceae bacterium]|jgi:hypothetical protein|nr:hypothetical protein [Pyrinomonadaceae bacterium]